MKTHTHIRLCCTATILLTSHVWGNAWSFNSAPLAAYAATGVEHATNIHEVSLPNRSACGWWTTTCPLPNGAKGIRFQGIAEIKTANSADFVYNDAMLFVQWNFPKGHKGKGAFYQRDFIRYTDRLENDMLIRTFDETYAVPENCDNISAQFICKWHAMTATLRDFTLEKVAPPPKRIVRCVVGNPHESVGVQILAKRRRAGLPITSADVFRVQLARIEATLTNIFAHVEHPDIILFSECLSGAGATNPADVAEPIPGGPSWNLAYKYATRYACNIAMDVKERDEQGICHNTVFICDRKGHLAGRYRKVHLTSGEYQQGLVPGNDFPIFDLDFGRVGALICWDNWFSESIKLVKREGAELLLFPLAGCALDHVNTCFPARAIDSGLPIMVAMRQGHLPNGILNRDGTWLDQTYEDLGFAVADVDLNDRKRTFWLSVGAGQGDPYELYYDESRPEVYEKFNWRQPRH